jgi:hypothetical protein
MPSGILRRLNLLTLIEAALGCLGLFADGRNSVVRLVSAEVG